MAIVDPYAKKPDEVAQPGQTAALGTTPVNYSAAAAPAPTGVVAKPAAPAPVAPTPTSPKPGPDWVPTQDGQGWVPPNHPMAWQAPQIIDNGGVANPVGPQQPIDNGGILNGQPAPNTPPPFNPATAPLVNPASMGADPAKLNPGDPVQGQPGAVWIHNGHGWVIQPAGAAAAGTPAAGAPGAPGATDPAKAQQDAFHKTLMDWLQTNQAATADDPVLRNQIDAFSSQRQLSRRQEQEAMAERLGAQGLTDSGAMDTGIQQSFEKAGQDTGAFSADLVGKEVTQRRDMIKTALALAGDQLSAEEKNALDRELAQLDAQVKREGIASSQKLGEGDLSARRYATDSASGTNLLDILMRNGQSQDRLGFDYTNAEAGHNYDFLKMLMGR